MMIKKVIRNLNNKWKKNILVKTSYLKFTKNLVFLIKSKNKHLKCKFYLVYLTILFIKKLIICLVLNLNINSQDDSMFQF